MYMFFFLVVLSRRTDRQTQARHAFTTHPSWLRWRLRRGSRRPGGGGRSSPDNQNGKANFWLFIFGVQQHSATQRIM